MSVLTVDPRMYGGLAASFAHYMVTDEPAGAKVWFEAVLVRGYNEGVCQADWIPLLAFRPTRALPHEQIIQGLRCVIEEERAGGTRSRGFLGRGFHWESLWSSDLT